MSDQRLLDLGMDDVHIDGAVKVPGKTKTMGDLTTKARKALPNSSFALPKQRKLPIQDRAHAVNAMARLEQIKSELSPADYASAKRKIQAAERKFGVKAAVKRAGKGGKGLRMRIHPGGMVDVRHSLSDAGECTMMLPPMVISSD